MLDGCMVVWIGPVLAISDTLPRIIQLLSRQAKGNPNIELSGTEENLQSLNPTPAPPRNKISWTVLPRTNSLCQLLVTFHPELHRHHSGRKENGLYLVPAWVQTQVENSPALARALTCWVILRKLPSSFELGFLICKVRITMPNLWNCWKD